MLRLQEYDYTLVYKSGRKDGDANNLSWCPFLDNASPDTDDKDPATLMPISIANMADEQTRDP